MFGRFIRFSSNRKTSSWLIGVIPVLESGYWIVFDLFVSVQETGSRFPSTTLSSKFQIYFQDVYHIVGETSYMIQNMESGLELIGRSNEKVTHLSQVALIPNPKLISFSGEFGSAKLLIKFFSSAFIKSRENFSASVVSGRQAKKKGVFL